MAGNATATGRLLQIEATKLLLAFSSAFSSFTLYGYSSSHRLFPSTHGM